MWAWCGLSKPQRKANVTLTTLHSNIRNSSNISVTVKGNSMLIKGTGISCILYNSHWAQIGPLTIKPLRCDGHSKRARIFLMAFFLKSHQSATFNSSQLSFKSSWEHDTNLAAVGRAVSKPVPDKHINRHSSKTGVLDALSSVPL